ncbi:hypothetical protein BS78_02G085700 [Paspalum vaginatum]|nr:hypothetical protein BS78_02G085700 [Paspalum vaginatum]
MAAVLAQVGMRAVLLIGIGAVGTPIALRSCKLAEILDELRDKGEAGVESGAGANANSGAGGGGIEVALAQQLAHLSAAVLQIKANNATVVVDTAGNGAGSYLIVPVATVGAVSYCYMWWKGISFSSLMYVTKRNMANAVANMTKHLEQVQSSLAAAKKHLTQRIQHVDDKLEQQKEISVQIKDQVTCAKLKIKNIGSDMNTIKNMVLGLDEKMDSIEAKQNYSCQAVGYLCKFIEERSERLPERLLMHEGLQQTIKRHKNKELTGLGFGQLLSIESSNTSAGRMIQSTGISSARLILP